MSTNVENIVFLVIFDTCDVVYNWVISLLPPIVLDNLFGTHYELCWITFLVFDILSTCK